MTSACLKTAKKNIWIGARSGVERIRANTLTQLAMPSQMQHNGVVLGDDGRRWVPSMNMNTFVVRADGQYQQEAAIDATAGTRAADGSVWLGGRKKNLAYPRCAARSVGCAHRVHRPQYPGDDASGGRRGLDVVYPARAVFVQGWPVA